MSSFDENPNCARTHATFRLVGDALNPEEVTAALAVEPTQASRKDDHIAGGRKGTPRIQHSGVWLLGSEGRVSSTSLERHLVYLLETIEPASLALDRLREERGLTADFFCYWLSATGHGGPELSSETFARIGALGAALGIDFYGPFRDSD